MSSMKMTAKCLDLGHGLIHVPEVEVRYSKKDPSSKVFSSEKKNAAMTSYSFRVYSADEGEARAALAEKVRDKVLSLAGDGKALSSKAELYANQTLVRSGSLEGILKAGDVAEIMRTGVSFAVFFKGYAAFCAEGGAE